MTVQAVKMRNASTGTWVTIAEPNEEIDIASVAQNGGVAGTFAANISIPVGTYDNFKLQLSETMKVSGNDGTNYTRQDGAVTINGSDGNAASTASWVAALPEATMVESVDTYSGSAEGEVTVTINLDAGDADGYIEIYYDDTSNPAISITVTESSEISMWFDFDTVGTILYYTNGECISDGFTEDGTGNGLCIFIPPQTGTQFQITVDGATTTITEPTMRIDF
ncbi:DUF4382 domain-containing protein [Thermoproteota archaeon]